MLTSTTLHGVASRQAPTSTMKALLKEGSSISVQLVVRPQLTDGCSVLVRVMLAGLCRTDLYAADGKIKVCDPLVLGHEFSGVIEEIGDAVDGLRVGQRVTVNPVLPCLECNYCHRGEQRLCQSSTFLGVDRSGCFAEFICVPAAAILPVPDGVSNLSAAYTEPVAASLAVLKTGILPSQKGMIYGKNRFSQLLLQILKLRGIENLVIYDPEIDHHYLEEGVFDYVIETVVSSQALTNMVRAIRPGGKIILKSRQYEPVMLRMNELLKKEPVLHVVNYGYFEDALALLASGGLDVEPLVDGIYGLEDFAKVLSTARQVESLKPFFAPNGTY